jgi:hypothetical protein
MTVIYFALHGPCIKIGCTGDVQRRVSEIVPDWQGPPQLLGTITGGFQLEADIHASLSSYRVRGEWFSDCPGVRDVMRQVLDGAFYVSPSAFRDKERPLLSELILAAKVRWASRAYVEVQRATGVNLRTAQRWLAGDSEMPGEATLRIQQVLADANSNTPRKSRLRLVQSNADLCGNS